MTDASVWAWVGPAASAVVTALVMVGVRVYKAGRTDREAAQERPRIHTPDKHLMIDLREIKMEQREIRREQSEQRAEMLPALHALREMCSKLVERDVRTQELYRELITVLRERK